MLRWRTPKRCKIGQWIIIDKPVVLIDFKQKPRKIKYELSKTIRVTREKIEYTEKN